MNRTIIVKLFKWKLNFHSYHFYTDSGEKPTIFVLAFWVYSSKLDDTQKLVNSFKGYPKRLNFNIQALESWSKFTIPSLTVLLSKMVNTLACRSGGLRFQWCSCQLLFFYIVLRSFLVHSLITDGYERALVVTTIENHWKNIYLRSSKY